ncbi:ABC transporter permease [Demequina zhanjiangensis]|uniref:ABC-type transport system involved in multi-copper enzyme maturation, permease component n=1 Tax=Demequina zhanjiangensis TaxID=3051659 RepID=A0ABT8G432_9MICO|nr:hypothetical protein [Demequina sp. SYSU T00b26]MDN4473908.1 hypothetical protein [Demequina sp. SYSU T00b26]
MTATDTAPFPPTPTPATKVPPRKGNPWRPTFGGVWLVTRVELLRRRPSVKGYIFYGLLLAAILALGILVAVVAGDDMTSTPLELVLVLVLGAGMLIGPSLSATSINGDSGEGVLAPLQMTHLTAGDLAVGKLLASWFVSFAVLVTTAPFLLYAYSRSGWHWHELLTVLGVIMAVVLVSTAIGLAWSAIAARAVASVSLAHLTTGFFLIGTLVIFAFTMPLVSETVTNGQRYIDWERLTPEQSEALDEAYMTGDFSQLDAESYVCVEDTWDMSVAHTERTAWMVLVNPVVVIGEVSPIVSTETYEEDGRAAPGLFAMMHQMVSSARIGPTEFDLESSSYDECAELVRWAEAGTQTWDDSEWEDQWAEQQEEQANYPRAPWLGLAVQAVLFVGSMAIVIRRLRVPYRTLRTGTRVA